jgi:hypothetical protein
MSRTFANQLVNTIDKTPISVLNYPLTPTEAAILAAAQEIQFGELLRVAVEDSSERVPMTLSSQQKAFVETLRNQGIRYLDTIIVHNGYPQQIEVEGAFGSIAYRRKIRFQ